MVLFNFGKKKEQLEAPACGCNGGCAPSDVESVTPSSCGEAVDGIRCIKVLGTGCASCHRLYANVQAALNNMGLSVEVEHITDIAKVMEYGVMSTPALVVNEDVVAMGKVLKVNEVEQLLHKLGF